jgi:ubiquinone/menaquinone biosynthesis C-methylase UbiE
VAALSIAARCELTVNDSAPPPRRATPLLRAARRAVLRRLDARLFRGPFEGRSAARYLEQARPAFGDFDERLLAALATTLRDCGPLLEVGAGPAAFALAAKRRFPQLAVLALEPSRELASAAAARCAAGSVTLLRAVAEALPLADRSIGVAVCLSSIRHVTDRGRALAELRRVLAPGGTLVIAELDPDAPPARVRNHADALRGRWLRAAFAPLVLRTAPASSDIEQLARAAGFRVLRRRDDPVQPLYLLELA